MNFSKKQIEKRIVKMNSKSSQRIQKLKIITLRLSLIAITFCILAAISGLIGMYNSIIDESPDISKINVIPTGYTTTIYDENNNKTQTLVGKDSNREYVTIGVIPTHLQNAFVAIEDERFWGHNGVDVPGVFRATVVGVTTGDFSQGASTITQQLLKNQVFDGGEESSFFNKIKRKLQEQYLAIQVEKIYNKHQILEYYLNTINLGQNTLGVEAASKRYFNKDVSALTLSESAVLAGITQNPSAYNPITNPKKNEKKRAIVLAYMKNQGFITTDEYTKAMNDKVYKRIQKVNKQSKSQIQATSYFTDALINQVIKDMKAKLGYTETQAYNALYSGGLTIYSTLDTKIQKICDNVINDPKFYPQFPAYQINYQLTVSKKGKKEVNYDFDSVRKWFSKHKKMTITQNIAGKELPKRFIKEFKKNVLGKKDKIIAENLDLIIQPQASFVLMDQKTGYVKAICGGRGEKKASRTLNRATSSTRQPGSTFKILSTYLPALDTAGLTLGTVQTDEKYNYPGTKRPVKNWYGERFRGKTTVRKAIANSMNVIAVKTLEKVTPKTGYDYLLNLGFTTLVDNYTNSKGKVYTDIGYPMALGGLTKGVTNLETTNAFATIANSGNYNTPTLYTKILDHNGNVLIDYTKENETKQVMKDSTAFLLTSAMKSVITEGTGSKLKFKNKKMSIAGKTGTTSDNNDLWFVGYTPYYTAGIWAGYDSNFEQIETSYHKVIWRTIMEKIHKNKKDIGFKTPSSITRENICEKCGKKARTSQIHNLRNEYFEKGTEPTDECSCK